MKQITPALGPVEGYKRALCCECGEVRLIKASARPRNRIPERFTEPEFLAKLHADGEHLDRQPYWRCLADLLCRNCRTLRRHALLRDHDRYADYAETLNRLGDRDFA